MATRKSSVKKRIKLQPGMLELTDINTLPKDGEIVIAPLTVFKYRYTTGPFLLPQNPGSLDWTILNNDVASQRARVTVFKCPVGVVKSAVAPGPIVVTIPPGVSTHNANTYPAGFAYEVQVECDSQLLFPYVSVWPGNWGVVIPGTGINSGTFLKLMP